MDRVCVGSLTDAQGAELVRVLRRSKDAIAVRRAEVVLCSAQGDSCAQIARRLHFSADYVRKIIHAFNEQGLSSLKARYENGGRPRKILPEHESELVELALMPPNLTGMPFTHWSLQTLRDEAVRRKLVPPIALESVRQVLLRHKVSLQRTKTWKQSTDPQFEEKKRPSKPSTRRRKPDANK